MKFLFAVIALFSVNAYAGDIDQIKSDYDFCAQEAMSTQEQVGCAVTAYADADVELNAVYKAINGTLDVKDKGDKTVKDALLEAQRAWIKYRDTNCAAYGTTAYGGTLAGVLRNSCLANMTIERTIELRDVYAVYNY